MNLDSATLVFDITTCSFHWFFSIKCWSNCHHLIVFPANKSHIRFLVVDNIWDFSCLFLHIINCLQRHFFGSVSSYCTSSSNTTFFQYPQKGWTGKEVIQYPCCNCHLSRHRNKTVHRNQGEWLLPTACNHIWLVCFVCIIYNHGFRNKVLSIQQHWYSSQE